MHRRSSASKGTFAEGEPVGRTSVCASLIAHHSAVTVDVKSKTCGREPLTPPCRTAW